MAIIQMEKSSLFFKYWGKAGVKGELDSFHLLPYHLLDVAAVAQGLLLERPLAFKQLSNLSAVGQEELLSFISLLVAMHDLGKFSDSFQWLRPDIAARLNEKCDRQAYIVRHDTLGYVLWRDHLKGWYKTTFNQTSKSEKSIWQQHKTEAIDYCLMAVTGHHGRPPKAESVILDRHFSECSYESARQWLTTLSKLIPLNTPIFDVSIRRAREFSWWLAGLTILADWIGSNTEYFPYEYKELPLADYWEKSMKMGMKAVRSLGLTEKRCSHSLSLADLLNNKTFQATELQEYCQTLSLGALPSLTIIEDVTGSGKTEAAMAIAQRIIAIGSASGLYIGLPTMATANAMHERISDIYTRFFENGSNPSLILAHSASKLRSRLILHTKSKTDPKYGDGLLTAMSNSGSWLTDNAKKAMLADIGVGTIDQSLMGILPTKHQSLRLMGLLGKVLIVDEVHACDAYMRELLKTLIEAHTTSGGSTILLSATLPKAQRMEFIEAYYRGDPQKNQTLPQSNKYPLVTHVSKTSIEVKPVHSRASVCRSVDVEYLHSREDVLQLIKDSAINKKCVCWVRNTVEDAIEAFELIKSSMPFVDATLFHARLALWDRLQIENEVLKTFGKRSGGTARYSKILVATQVVEQSLDIDFDVMITDLAPIDLVIQRAGRLQRHCRNEQGVVVSSGQDARASRKLFVYGPDPLKKPDERWYSRLFGRGQYVYPNHAQLWLTADILTRLKRINLPNDMRDYVEYVYGDEGMERVPKALIERAITVEGKELADKSQGRLNSLNLQLGYSETATNLWWDEANVPTRLGDPTIVVYLARCIGEELRPWCELDPDVNWQLSSLRVRRNLIESVQGYPESVLQEKLEKITSQAYTAILLPLVAQKDGSWQVKIRNPKETIKLVRYSARMGLQLLDEDKGSKS